MNLRLLSCVVAVGLTTSPTSPTPPTAPTAPTSPTSPTAPASWVQRSAIYEVFVRDFSQAGNLRGVTRGLDRIQATGANVIWLMPIFPVGIKKRKDPLGSPYSVRDNRAINPD